MLPGCEVETRNDRSLLLDRPIVLPGFDFGELPETAWPRTASLI